MDTNDLLITPCLCVVPVGEECPDCGRVMTEERAHAQIMEELQDYINNGM
jgi:hypothetical protein